MKLPPLRKYTDRLPKRGSPARFWMHVPLGIVTMLAVLVSPVAAGLLTATFLAYETLEDWRLHDWSYIDVEGYMAGLVVGIGILVVVEFVV